MKKTAAILIALLFVLAACGNDSDTSTTTSTTGDGVDPSSTTGETPPDSQGSAEVGDVSLTVTGGIAGLNEEIVVQADGTVLYSGDPDQQPEATGETLTADALHAAVASEEFADLESTYVPADYCCDQFHYEVTAVVDGEEITSVTADGIEAPDALDEVVAQLNSLI